MLLGEMISVALQSIRANLFRGFLTMLGIIIGVGSVITMVALGSGAQQAIDEQIDALGASVLSIRSKNMFQRGVAVDAPTLAIEDAAALEDGLRTVQAIVPEQSGRLQVKFGGDNKNVLIVGTTPNYPAVNNFSMQMGEMFTDADDAARRRVAVLGNEVVNRFELEPGEMLGADIYIGGVSFSVIGILAEKGQTGWRNVDDQILIPLQTGQSRIFGNKTLEVISAQVSPGFSAESAIVDIERVLRHEHQIMPGRDNDFSVGDPREFFNVRQAAANIFAYLLAGIASISLIVGGIGIMNIMLVTVTERTREIGIRKALGATRANILMQFLVESLVLCLLGGAIGVLFGTGIAFAMSRLLGWQTVVSPSAVLIAFAFSAGVGLFFGIWPARKAARLDPIEALRHE